MSWEEEFEKTYQDFLDGKYLIERFNREKRLSNIHNGYGIYIVTNGKFVEFEALAIENYKTFLFLYFIDEKVTNGQGPYEEYVGKAISLLTLHGLGEL